MNIRNLIQDVYEFIDENKYNLLILIVILVIYYYFWYNSEKSDGLKKLVMNRIKSIEGFTSGDTNIKDLEEDGIIFALELYNIEPNKEKGETHETAKFIAVQNKDKMCDKVFYKDYINVPGLDQDFLGQEATHMNNQLIIKPSNPTSLDMSIFFSIVPRKVESIGLSDNLKKELNPEDPRKAVLEDKIIKSASTTPYVLTITNSVDEEGNIRKNYGQMIYGTSGNTTTGASISMNDISKHGIAEDGSPIVSFMMKGYAMKKSKLQPAYKNKDGKDMKYVIGQCCNDDSTCYIPKCTFNQSSVNNPRVCASGTNLTFKVHKYAIVYLSRKNGEEREFKTIYTPLKFKEVIKTLDADKLPIKVIELVNNALIEKNSLIESVKIEKSGKHCHEISYFPYNDEKKVKTIKFEHEKFTLELTKDVHGNLENKFMLCNAAKQMKEEAKAEEETASPELPDIEPPSGEAPEESNNQVNIGSSATVDVMATSTTAQEVVNQIGNNQAVNDILNHATNLIQGSNDMVEGFNPNAGTYARIRRSNRSSYGYF